MEKWEEAIVFIDEMLVLDQQLLPVPEDLFKKLEGIGPMTLHRAFYDTGIFSQDVVLNVLNSNPEGILGQALTWLISQRADDYSEDTLRKMYGLDKL